MRWAILGLGLSLFATGLCSPTQPEADVDQDVVLAPGQSADVAGAPMTIRFEAVVSDNRCPVDVECIQAGDGVIQISVSGGGASAEHQLHTTGEPKSVKHGDLEIALLQLRPQPVSTRAIQPDEYRATLRVRRET
jgi:hypothetical protein